MHTHTLFTISASFRSQIVASRIKISINLGLFEGSNGRKWRYQPGVDSVTYTPLTTNGALKLT